MDDEVRDKLRHYRAEPCQILLVELARARSRTGDPTLTNLIRSCLSSVRRARRMSALNTRTSRSCGDEVDRIETWSERLDTLNCAQMEVTNRLAARVPDLHDLVSTWNRFLRRMRRVGPSLVVELSVADGNVRRDRVERKRDRATRKKARKRRPPDPKVEPGDEDEIDDDYYNDEDATDAELRELLAGLRPPRPREQGPVGPPLPRTRRSESCPCGHPWRDHVNDGPGRFRCDNMSVGCQCRGRRVGPNLYRDPTGPWNGGRPVVDTGSLRSGINPRCSTCQRLWGEHTPEYRQTTCNQPEPVLDILSRQRCVDCGHEWDHHRPNRDGIHQCCTGSTECECLNVNPFINEGIPFFPRSGPEGEPLPEPGEPTCPTCKHAWADNPPGVPSPPVLHAIPGPQARGPSPLTQSSMRLQPGP